jgi:hypothetical protein
MKNRLYILSVTLLLVLLVAGCVAPQNSQIMTLEPGPDGNPSTGTSIATHAPATIIAPPATTPALTTTVPAQPAVPTPPVSTPPYTPPPATPVPAPSVVTEEKPTMNIILGTFDPKRLIVAKNTEVVFGDIDHYNYRIFSPGLFDTDLLSEDIFVFIFSEPGTYQIWIDSVQKGETLEGMVIVTE